MNIITLVENMFGHGAVKQDPSPSIPNLDTVAGDTAPFDWRIGFDIRDTLYHKANIQEIPTKNQGQSGSCGGQAWSYLTSVADALNDGVYTEKSARFIYAPVHVQGGGSAENALVSRVLNIGSAEEHLVPSYEAGNPPGEAFMEKIDDIDQTDLQNALGAKGLKAIYLDPTDIDALAQAIRDYGGFVMGIEGDNNGTWLSSEPKPPTSVSWRHWIYFGQAKMIAGRKLLGFKNSWGDTVGVHGWQWIDESYLNGHTWGACTVVLMSPPPVKYTFNVTLKLGDNNADVQKLQTKLKQLGFFPPGQAITSYFGQITKQAVIAFQTANGITPTGTFGILSRTKLNTL